MSQKFLQITPDILLEWDYSTGKVSETYQKLTNISSGKVSFMSTAASKNDAAHTLFVVDPVVRKLAKVDTDKFNFLQIQSYFTSPVQYDTIKIHFSTEYDFDDNIGFLLSTYTFDHEHQKYIYFSDFFYDKTDLYSERSMNLQIPFLYGEKEWNRNITISIPSLNEVGGQRQVSRTRNIAFPFTINANMSSNGISETAPILIEFSYLTGSETTLGQKYYYLGDIYKKSVTRIPQYSSLGVMVRESPDWDFFEIYGYYNTSSENLDNFVNQLESQGRKIKINYTVTLYEENVRSGYPIVYTVDENFSQKIEYRPVFKFSNTTAAIDVQMDVIDLVDYSTITRRATLGLTNNLFKYGKKLTSINITNAFKPNIYNYKPNPTFNYDAAANAINYTITKVPYPVLIETYKILVNSSNTTNLKDEFKSMGLTTLILSPFDNIIKFQIYEQKNNSTPEPYKISDALVYGKLVLIFKSDTEEIKKEMFYESSENKLDIGVVVFKINENDINSIKRMVRDKKDNFYIVLEGYKTKTLLYSGKVQIFENLKFIDFKGGSWQPYIPMPALTGITNINQPIPELNINEKKVRKISTFPSKELSPGEIFLNEYNKIKVEYSNYLIFVKTVDPRVGANTTTNNYEKFNSIKNKLINGQYGINENNLYYYDENQGIILIQKGPKNNFTNLVLNPQSLDPSVDYIMEINIGLGIDPNLLKIPFINSSPTNETTGRPGATNVSPPTTSIITSYSNGVESSEFKVGDEITIKLDLTNSSNIDDTTRCKWDFNSTNNITVIASPSVLENKLPSETFYISYTSDLVKNSTSVKIQLIISNSFGSNTITKILRIKKENNLE